MGTRDKRVDAYIAKSADWAKPILERAREWVHEGCPDVEETLKWGAPTFMYNGIMCGMVAFKESCLVHFWKGELLKDENGVRPDESWGEKGRLAKLSDFPTKKEFIATVKKAASLNEGGVKVPKRVPKPKKLLTMPPEFSAAIKKNKKAQKTFNDFSPSHQREYLEWITDAKGDDTRARRIAQAVEWMAEGKPRNWKYM